MEGGAPPPPPLPPQNTSSYYFTPTLPSTILHPPSLLLHHDQQSQTAPHVDWVTLLSTPIGLTSQNLMLADTTTTSVTAGIRVEEEKGGGKDKGKTSRIKKVNRPKFAFQTRSADDILDDGYRWRKYGQKSVKNSNYPRSYYRCTHHTCNVKKQVQRLSKDRGVVVTTYEGIHNHPCEKLMESLSPLLKQMQFLHRF